MRDSGRVQLTDVVIAAVVSIAAYALGPVYYDMIEIIAADAGPLSQLMLQLMVPFLFIGIIISVGVSARRRD
jgi:hypothetical protein